MSETHWYESHPELRPLAVLLIILTILFLVTNILGSRIERMDHSVPRGHVVGDFPQVELVAKAAYVYDLRTDTVLFAKDENESLPLASLTKIMTALVAHEKLGDDAVITVDSNALETEGLSGLVEGEKWHLKDLLDFALMKSSNDAMSAVALAYGGEETFVDAMNAKARELGLTDTHFLNETGLDLSETVSGAEGSAKDYGDLMAYMVENYPDILEATKLQSKEIKSFNIVHKVQNTNTTTDALPGLVASKTGLTDLAGGNLAVVFDPELGRPIVIVVLGSTEEGRFQDIANLTGATMQFIQTEN